MRGLLRSVAVSFAAIEMVRTLRPIASLLGGTALLLLGVGLLNTLIPLRGKALGYSDTLLGGLTSAYYAGYLLGTFLVPPLIRRIGHIRAFAFCTSGVACVVLLHALGDSAVLWLALRFLAGAVLVGLYTIIESWLNASAPSAQRGGVFAAYMVVNLGALALAQQLLRIQGQPFVLFTVVALLLCAATLPVVATRLAQPALQATPSLRLQRLFATAPSAGAGALLSGLAMGAFWGLLPIYHLAPEELLAASSSVLLVYGIGSAVGPLAAGTLMSGLGTWSLFGWFALTQGALAAYAGYRYQAFRREQATEPHFRTMLRTTPMVLEMLPDTDVDPERATPAADDARG